jgi:hypothetical protein
VVRCLAVSEMLNGIGGPVAGKMMIPGRCPVTSAERNCARGQRISKGTRNSALDDADMGSPTRVTCFRMDFDAHSFVVPRTSRTCIFLDAFVLRCPRRKCRILRYFYSVYRPFLSFFIPSCPRVTEFQPERPGESCTNDISLFLSPHLRTRKSRWWRCNEVPGECNPCFFSPLVNAGATAISDTLGELGTSM